jgi:uncharacterized protein (DUF1330 family)
MSAYILAQIQIDDADEHAKYLADCMPIFERHGSELLATSINLNHVIEGECAYPGTVIMKLPDSKAAPEWLADPEYLACRAS